MGLLRKFLLDKEYKYYDSPEGEDCFKKIWFVSKYCGIYGVLVSTLDVLLYSHPKGYGPTLARYAYITLPLVGMGATFATTTCIATNIRKKDDHVNYFCGGYAAGAVLGAWQRSIKYGVYGGLALAIFAVLKKDSIDNNWSMLGIDVPQKYGNFWSLKRDFSILEDPGKEWKTK